MDETLEQSQAPHSTQALPPAQQLLQADYGQVNSPLNGPSRDDPALPRPDKRRKLHDDGKHLFECEQCAERFTRFENLKRHMRNHDATSNEQCPCCPVKCKRPDLLKRHVKKFHPEMMTRLYAKPAASHTEALPRAGGREQLATTDAAQTLTSLAMPAHVDPALQLQQEHGLLIDSLNGFVPSLMHTVSNELMESPFTESEMQTFTALYFQHFHSTFPIVHQASFDKRQDETPWQLLPVACIGALYTNDAAIQKRAVALVKDLFAIFKMHGLDTSRSDRMSLGIGSLLLCYFGLFRGDALLHTSARELLAARIFQQRRLGFSAPVSAVPIMADAAERWPEYIQQEAHSRFVYGLYLLEMQVSLIFGGKASMDVAELSCRLPLPERTWEATTAESWIDVHERVNETDELDGDLPSRTHGHAFCVNEDSTLAELFRVLLHSRLNARQEKPSGLCLLLIVTHLMLQLRKFASAEYVLDPERQLCKGSILGDETAPITKVSQAACSVFQAISQRQDESTGTLGPSLQHAALLREMFARRDVQPNLVARGVAGRRGLLQMLEGAAVARPVTTSLQEAISSLFASFDATPCKFSGLEKRHLRQMTANALENGDVVRQCVLGDDCLEDTSMLDPVTAVIWLQGQLLVAQALQWLRWTTPQICRPDEIYGRSFQQLRVLLPYSETGDERVDAHAAAGQVADFHRSLAVLNAKIFQQGPDWIGSFVKLCVEKTADMQPWQIGALVGKAAQEYFKRVEDEAHIRG